MLGSTDKEGNSALKKKKKAEDFSTINYYMENGQVNPSPITGIAQTLFS